MVTMTSLWLAILLSALIVWIASAIVWMVLPHHKKDFRELPDEEATRSALGSQNVQPGQYHVPHMASMSEMKQPEGQRKLAEGPVAFITVLRPGAPALGKKLALSFLYYVLVGIAVAYVATRLLAAGADYLAVFRLTGTVAWLAYSAAVIPDAVWLGRPWSVVAKQLADGLAYALLTAGVFGWLWPR